MNYSIFNKETELIIAKKNIANNVLDYIKYNNFEVVDSKINSVFDLLYSGLYKDRRDYLKGSKQISEYDSENLIYKIIEELLKNEKFGSLNVIAHYPLQKLLIDNLSLTPSERAYAFHPNTHLDFIIYNKLSKSTVLAIEVDGYKYHKAMTVQNRRDSIKDRVLDKYEIPLLRLNTTGNSEKEKISNKLNQVLNI